MNQAILAISRLFLVGLVSIIVATAVMVGLGRQFLSHIDAAHSQVETFLSDKTGLVIQFDQINGAWKQLTPQLDIRHLNVKKNQQADAFMDVKQLRFEIDLGKSLLYFRPIIKLWVEGAALELVYGEEGFLLMNAPESKSGAETSKSDFIEQLDFLFKQPHIQLSDSAIHIKGFWEQDVVVSDIDVGIARNGVGKRFWADLSLAGMSDISVSVKGDLQGRFSTIESLQGHLYAQVNAPDLASWTPLPVQELTALEVTQAGGEIELWGRVRDGVIERVTSRFELQNVQIKQEGTTFTPPRLHQVTGIGKWEGDWQNDWLVGLQSLVVEGEGFNWAPERLVLQSFKAAKNERKVLGKLDKASISPWVRYYLSFLDQESKAFKTLNKVNPDADLEDVVLTVDLVDKKVDDFNLSARLSNITTHSKRWVPGINNVTARLLLGKYSSVIELQGKNIDLNYPALFRKPMMVDHLKGALLISNGSDELVIESGLIEVDDEQFNIVSQFAVVVDKLSGQPPYLRLQANLHNIDAGENLNELLPVGVISKGVVTWIDKAVKAGQLLRGDLLFHGPINAKEIEPFQSILGFTIDNSKFEYLEGWKPVEDLTADIRIYNGVVDAWALGGSYYGAEVTEAWIGTERIEPGKTELTVDAKIKGRLEHAAQILLDAPIKEKTQPIMERLHVEGDGLISVVAKVPLYKGPSLDLLVDVNIENGLIKLKDQGLVVNNLSGAVQYDLKKGLFSTGVNGELFGGEVAATIETLPEGEQQQTLIKANGKAMLAMLKPWLKLDLLAPISGELDYSADVYIKPEIEAAQIARSYVEIKSDLEGALLNYPAPFYKESNDALPLSYKTTLGGVKSYQSLKLGELFDLQMLSKDGVLNRGAVAFNETASLPDQRFFTIAGNLSEFNVAAWQKTYALIDGERIKLGRVERSPSLLNVLGQSSLTVGQFQVQGQTFNDLELKLFQEEDLLKLAVASPTLKGMVELPVDYLTTKAYREIPMPVVVNIDNASLQIAKTDAESSESNEQEKGVDPRVLPSFDLSVKQLNLNDENYGSWAVTLKPMEEGVSLDQINFKLKEVGFNGSGYWKWNEEGGETLISGKGEAGNVADVLRAWGYAPTLTSEKATMRVHSKWPKAPFQFDLLKASADIDLVVKEGRFKGVSSGTADKVLGFLNFDDWLSRLRLKIEDLESNEMPFGEIRGDFNLDDKVLTAKKLEMDSAAMKMAMTGEINVEAKHISANLDVTIPVTRNLVLPAAAVGGLPAAATVYVIEKVLGSQLDKLTTMKYKLDGSLKEPTVTLEESFNIIPKQIQESIVTNGAQDATLEQAVEPQDDAGLPQGQGPMDMNTDQGELNVMPSEQTP